jgi:hypothetical protein
MRFGAESLDLLVVFDAPFGAAAGFELLEQLQFAFGFEEADALLGDLLMKLLPARLERGGAALNVGLEVRQRDVVFPSGRRGMADVSAGVVKLHIERVDLVPQALAGIQQTSKMSAFRFGLLSA